jgi:hypothetical protein
VTQPEGITAARTSKLITVVTMATENYVKIK